MSIKGVVSTVFSMLCIALTAFVAGYSVKTMERHDSEHFINVCVHSERLI